MLLRRLVERESQDRLDVLAKQDLQDLRGIAQHATATHYIRKRSPRRARTGLARPPECGLDCLCMASATRGVLLSGADDDRGWVSAGSCTREYMWCFPT